MKNNRYKLFNNALEAGVRCINILVENEQPLDLQRLIYYDYISLHFGDVDSSFESLHPANPFHSTEMIVRRRVIQRGLEIICSKGLVDIVYSNNGIEYRPSNIAAKFLSYFESEYFKSLQYFARLTVSKFKHMNEQEIKQYISLNIDRWNGEFEEEVLFRGD